MVDRLILDYRRGGSPELGLGEPLSDAISIATFERARSLLVARGESRALALLEDFDFTLRRGANGLGDEFLAAHAFATPAAYARMRDPSGRATPDAQAAGAALRKATDDAYKEEQEVRFLAIYLIENVVRGSLGEYVFEEDPFDRGAFATVHRARDGAGQEVALKRLLARDDEAIGRMRREIQEQGRMTDRNVMPILDHDATHRWFIMPLADENLAARSVRTGIDDALLCEVLRASAMGLAVAHALGLVHRDVTPRNILRLGSEWVVADWGVVRRPRGMTTLVRTQGEMGTNGFAAPELFREAHEAAPAADVYALGRIAAWAATRSWPEQNLPLLPDGIWRQFVRRTTEHESSRRPQSMSEVLKLLESIERDLHAEGRQPAVDDVVALVERLGRGEVEALDPFLTIALERDRDSDLYVDEIAPMNDAGIAVLVETRPTEAQRVTAAMHNACKDGHWGSRSFDYLNVPLRWIHSVARAAERKGELGLLDDAVSALFELEPSWDRWAQQARTRTWLEELEEGDGAATVARALRRQPEAAALYLKQWTPRKTPESIRAALVAAERALAAVSR